MPDNRFGEEAVSLTDYIDSFDVSASQPISTYFQRYGTHVPLIVGDHSTHTIDVWKGRNEHLRSNTTNLREPSADLLQRVSTPALIKQLNPGAKFIIVIRDPVSRIFSLYRYHIANSQEDFHKGVIYGTNWWKACLNESQPLLVCLFGRPQLKTYNNPDPDSSWNAFAMKCVRRGLYHLILKEWFAVFPREQFLILRFNDYVSNMSCVINDQIFPFLGLPRLSGFNALSMDIRKGIHIESFRAKIKEGRLRIKDTYWNKGDMWSETRNVLNAFYSEHNKKLAELLGNEKYLWG